MDLLTPRVHYRHTHTQKQCTARGPLRGLPSLRLTTEGAWIHLRGHQVSRQLSDAVTPVSNFRNIRLGGCCEAEAFCIVAVMGKRTIDTP